MEVVDHISSVGDVGGSIQSEEGVFSKVHEVLKNVYHFGHLTKDQHFVTIFLLLLQNKI